MAATFQNAQFSVEHERRHQLAVVRRSTAPFASVEEMARAHTEVEAALQKLKAKRLLIDVRDGPAGRNDPAFEEGGRAGRQRLTQGFELIAILVRTAAGELHATRLARLDGIECVVFSDEAAALAYLGADDGPPSGSS
jgi:hypothetical protein